MLTRLRSATASAHRHTEDLLDLTAPGLTLQRLQAVVSRLGSFWSAAEAGLETWAADHPQAADDLVWPLRRRRHLFARDAAALGGGPLGPGPAMPDVATTAEALGRLYVLEGSSLGGQVINAALAARSDGLAAVRLGCLSPYAERTGAMWHAYRSFVAAWPTEDADVIVAAAVATFTALEVWVTSVELAP